MSLKLQLGLQEINLREVTKQEFDILRGKIADKVGSEVTEAILALDREEPNIEIALRRLHADEMSARARSYVEVAQQATSSALIQLEKDAK